ncbi:hypothetical protein Ancab_015998 [Ancistrocladus abbreviatus]
MAAPSELQNGQSSTIKSEPKERQQDHVTNDLDPKADEATLILGNDAVEVKLEPVTLTSEEATKHREPEATPIQSDPAGVATAPELKEDEVSRTFTMRELLNGLKQVPDSGSTKPDSSSPYSEESSQPQQVSYQNNAAMELINSVTGVDEEGQSRQRILSYAARRYASAIERNPTDYDAFYNWALVLQESADNVDPDSSSPSKDALLEEACKKYEEATRLCPTLHDAYYNWAIAISDRARMRGRTKEAEELWKQATGHYEKTVQLNWNSPQALNNWGLALQELSAIVPAKEKQTIVRTAISKFRAAIQLQFDFHRAIYNLGTVLYGLAEDTLRIGGSGASKEVTANELYSQCAIYIAAAHALKPNYSVYRSALRLVRSMLPLPYLKVGFLTAPPAGNPIAPHCDWKRTQFVLNHEGLYQLIPDEQKEMRRSLSAKPTDAMIGKKPAVRVDIPAIVSVSASADLTLPPGAGLCIDTIQGPVFLVADSWESLDGWLDAIRLVYTIFARACFIIMLAEGSTAMRSIPAGISLVRRLRGKDWSFSTYRHVVLLVTFIAYTCYHASRKPSSIVKSVLYPELAKSSVSYPWPIGYVFTKEELLGSDGTKLRSKGWAPFNGKDGTSKLGEIDLAFLACYSIGMYFAGHLGDTLDLRLFLTSGMIGSGIFVALFGMGYFWNIHIFWFYLAMQMVAGLFQATGWPSVVAVIGNWFGKRKRGLIMGIWNAHTSVGNITGSLLAASVLKYGWGWSFIVPGSFIFLGGILVFLFLAAYPEDVGFPCPNDLTENVETGLRDEEAQRQREERFTSSNRRSVGLLQACMIPGVIPFAFCLLFAKLVAYTFLYWLPFYLSQTAIGGEYVSVQSAGNLSTLFDVGGIIGGILAGYISDKLNARAITAASFMYVAIPSMLLYRSYGSVSMTVNIILMMIAGLFVNGPYALITTAVSADLGTHCSLRGDSRALATVTAIIDGTGSVGAALGPLLTGFLSTKGWDAVFLMLMVCALIAGLLLSRLVMAEITDLFRRNPSSNEQHGLGGTESQPLLSDQR